MNFNLDLPNFDHHEENQDDQKSFDWDEEFEFIEKTAIKECRIFKHINPYECKGRVVTLEGDFFDLACKVQGGIKIVFSNKEDLIGKVYESLHTMMMKCSPMYIEECFSNF